MQGCHFLSIDGMCRDSVQHGMAILHGTGGVYEKPKKEPYTYMPMRIIYDTLLEVTIMTKSYSQLPT